MALELTTRTAVKARLGITSAGQDAVIDAMILSVSRRIEREMQRHVVSVERTETYELPPARQVLSLRGFPVDLSADLLIYWSALDRDFSGVDPLIVNEDFTVDTTNGMLRLYFKPSGYRATPAGRVVHPAYFQVTYTGGMVAESGSPASSAANFIADYPDVAQAAEDQVAYLYRRRDNQGSNKTLHGSSAMYEEAYNLLPSVRETARYYRADPSFAQ